MSTKLVAFALAAATGMVVASEPAVSAGGARFAPAGPRIMAAPAARFFRPSLKAQFFHGGPAQSFRHAPPLAHIPPSARGYATTSPQRPYATVNPQRPYATTSSPQRPFGRLVRRHHGIYHSGWYFPVTYGGDASPGYYIGTPYDPAEAFPVYAPAPEDPVDPAPAPMTSRAVNAAPGEACRSEQVTVPAGDGERTITVVRC